MALTVDFNIKRNDTLPSVSGTLLDPDGNAVNLTGATVKFIYRLSTEPRSAAVSGSVVLVDENNGVVRFDWTDGDTDVPGIYFAEFETTFGTGEVQTTPNTSNLILRIFDDVGTGNI